MCASSQLGLELQHDSLQLLLLLLALDRQLLHFGSQTLVVRLHVLQLRLPQADQLLQVTLQIPLETLVDFQNACCAF